MDMEETHDIHREGSVLIGRTATSTVSLTGAELVCMNTWYFTRRALSLMRDEWHTFTQQPDTLPSDVEFGLAPVVKTLLSKGLVRVHAETTPDECFGLTNPGDDRQVAERLSTLNGEGLYPSPLWTDEYYAWGQ